MQKSAMCCRVTESAGCGEREKIAEELLAKADPGAAAEERDRLPNPPSGDAACGGDPSVFASAGCVVVGMKILIGCEFSGTARESFRRKGHDAWSCDILESEDNSPFHIQGDVLEIVGGNWDMAIFHPPCTHLAVSGARYFAAKRADGRQQDALEFVRKLMACPIPRWAIENPVSIISSHIRKPDQVIQPWMFGHGETKATCLWLHGLPLLTPTSIVEGRDNKIHRMSPGPSRWKDRSRTYQGIAEAMAAQWNFN